MNPQYIEFDGKHPASKKGNRHYSNKPNSRWVSYGCKYSDDFFKLDIDDYDHESYKLEEPIKSKPRSEAVISLLDSLNIKYNGIRTEHGVHLFFRVPTDMQKKTIPPWYSVIGIKCEWKFPAKDDHIPLQINNVKRSFFKGSIDNTDIDELPFFLYPLQKSKERPYDITFPRGSRTQELGGYLFHLISKDMKGLHITPEQAFKVVEYMNFYVFDEPIPKDALNTQILNESTLEKLKENQKEASDKKLSHGQYTESYWKPLLVDMGILTYTNDKGEVKEHTPDDTRHTFTTMWKEKKLDEAFRRKIQGHSGKGIGEIVYTHLEFAKLLEELNKL